MPRRAASTQCRVVVDNAGYAEWLRRKVNDIIRAVGIDRIFDTRSIQHCGSIGISIQYSVCRVAGLVGRRSILASTQHGGEHDPIAYARHAERRRRNVAMR